MAGKNLMRQLALRDEVQGRVITPIFATATFGSMVVIKKDW
jgi:hypothetical protein